MALSLMAVIVCSMVVGADAASRNFQPQLRAPIMRSLRSNSTMQKRWLGVQTGSGNLNVRLWPNKEIKYAFADDDTQLALFELFLEAQAAWAMAGLPLWTEYKMTIMSPAECHADRANCLLITKNSEGRAVTDPALAPVGVYPGFVGPTMNIDPTPPPDELASRRMSPALVVAHEIGHAWGLMHEHQNPAYWSKDFNGGNTGFDGSVFGKSNFHCGNLPDYAAAKARIQANPNAGPDDENLICTDINYARYYRFSASAWLPERAPGFVGDNMSNKQQGPDDVDWDSIMLYSTYMTGQSVLIKPNGDEIAVPVGPSERDVQGIEALYGGKYELPNVILLNQPSNPQQASFNQIACAE